LGSTPFNMIVSRFKPYPDLIFRRIQAQREAWFKSGNFWVATRAGPGSQRVRVRIVPNRIAQFRENRVKPSNSSQ
jgi:hypothetical protein